MSQIQVHVLNATELPNMDFLDKTDAYVKVTMAGKEVLRTKVIDNNLNPVWDEKATVMWDGTSDLLFSIWDSDLLTSDDWVGQYLMSKHQIKKGFKGAVPLNVGTKFKKGSGSKQPTLTIKVVPPDSGCCGDCSIM
mmetsp:Transcript_107925/g.315573  ORF Transcript_107925/g.315573 Transcript_107925/m.315573 type:complete len:136 (-) Transcript_107925:101-508(-)